MAYASFDTWHNALVSSLTHTVKNFQISHFNCIHILIVSTLNK